jgi:hypothetical protein
MERAMSAASQINEPTTAPRETEHESGDRSTAFVVDSAGIAIDVRIDALAGALLDRRRRTK